jgi:hypothetical protein
VLQKIYPYLLPPSAPYASPLCDIIGFPGFIRNTANRMEKMLEWGQKKQYSKGDIISFDKNEFGYVFKGATAKIIFPDQEAERWALVMGAKTLLGSGYILNSYIGMDPGKILSHISHGSLILRCTRDTTLYVFQTHKLIEELPEDLLADLKSALFYDYAYKSIQYMTSANIQSLPTSYLKVAVYLYSIYNNYQSLKVSNPGFSLFDISFLLGIHKSGFYKVIGQMQEEGLITNISKKNIEFGDTDRLLAIIQELIPC